MGIKTEISFDDISPYFDVISLEPTLNGVSHTVYVLNDNYILKIYEDVKNSYVDEEINLLNLCKSLSVPKIEKQLYIKNKKALIFQKSKGHILNEVQNTHLVEIANFLKAFHRLTKNKKHQSENPFSRESLEKLVLKAKNKFFISEFKSINLVLKNDGVIHGDLFLDNSVFSNDKLSCVFDFSDACEGDFLFDLAVVALSWCKNKNQVLELLEAYDRSIELNYFIKYMRYASLYYCVTRFLDNRDYGNILFEKKFKDLLG